MEEDNRITDEIKKLSNDELESVAGGRGWLWRCETCKVDLSSNPDEVKAHTSAGHIVTRW